jgi:hypothetical protein
MEIGVTTASRVDLSDFLAVHRADSLAAPQLADLAIECSSWYGYDAETAELKRIWKTSA